MGKAPAYKLITHLGRTELVLRAQPHLKESELTLLPMMVKNLMIEQICKIFRLNGLYGQPPDNFHSCWRIRTGELNLDCVHLLIHFCHAKNTF